MRQGNQQRPKRGKTAKDVNKDRLTPEERPVAANKKSFPVAGIGASAGGLEAFTALLKHLPTDTGMAFVVVQHLSPTHDGILPGLLAKTTKMPVLEVKSGMEVEPNHVYVIPPNASMAITDGVLKLLPRQVTQGSTRSIDFFFQSLAETRGQESVGVILSGTASDGTIGLEAIKAEGGITFAQDESAKFDSMPRSAIAAGCVDFVLSPPAIARELARVARHPYVASPKTAQGDEAEIIEPGDDFKAALAMVRRASGNDFSAYKSATLHRRLHRRMALGKFKDLTEYNAYLNTHPAEVEALTGDFLIGVTNFFRDPSAFEFLKKKAFPKLLKARQSRPQDEALRFWVLGCSTGQEAYSLAMAWQEFAAASHANPTLQVFSTDVHNPYLDRARSGVYSKSLLQDVSPERLRRFFVEVDGGYRVTKAIRDMCVFAKQNIISDPPFSHIDLVSCRNLLIYLRPELQKRIVPVFHFALKPTGYLFLGPAETVTGFGHLFSALDPKVKVFARKPGPSQVETRFTPSPLPPPKVLPAVRPAAADSAGGQDALREADRLMLARYAPVGVLINGNLDVLQFRGYTGRYLEAAPGKATLNVLKMAREGLLSPMRSAIKRAAKDNAPIKTPGITVKENGRALTFTLEVIPLKHRNDEQRCFLITFEPAPQVAGEPAAGKALNGPSRARTGSTTEIAHVRRELAETKEHLQSVIEQQDAYNEELQSANEEGQAANEELQSINEEMETAKEELQAGNEELTTLNEELHSRSQQLALTSGDLANLLTSVNMAIVMLGRDLCIRRFTAQAEKILCLVPTDVGRPITDLNFNIPVQDLEQSLTQVIETVTSKEQEVQDREGRWYALRIRPYMTSDNKIDGAVMILVDVDELKRKQKEISAARDYAQHIVETVGDALLVLDHSLIVQSANRSFYEMFRVSPQETEKRYLYSLGDGQWNIPGLRKLLEEILPKNQEVHDFEVEHNFPRIGRRIIRVNARSFVMPASHRESILLALKDITERARAKEELAEKARLLDLTTDAIIVRGRDDKISLWNKGAEKMYGWPCEEVIGKDLHSLMHTEFPKPYNEIVAQLHREGHFEGEVVQIAQDGRRVTTLCRWVLDSDTKSILTSYTDITARRQAEETRARLAAIVEFSEDAILSKDMSGIITSWNGAAERLLGYSAPEAIGQPASMLIPQDRIDEEPAILERIRRGEAVEHFETVRRRKDGTLLNISLTVSPIRDSEGQITGASKIARDISNRKRNEEALRRAQAQLADRASQLEQLVVERTGRLQETVQELESYSYSIAHDMRAPLRSMSSFARLVQTEHAEQLDEVGKKHLGRVIAAAQRLDRLVTDVLNYSRSTRRAMELHSVDLEKLLEEAIRNEPAFQAPLAEIEIQSPMPRVIAHDPSLMQVVTNLLSNAVKFVLPGVVPRVTVRTELVDQDVRLWFEDNGIGIAAADRGRIFSLFGRLNPASEFEGTGIGLTIVRKAVERMGGKVGVESEPGQGSRFWIQLKHSETI